jgi:large subunit ribosomal protein L19
VSQSLIDLVNAKYKKPQVIDVHSGDTIRVHQKIREGNKERIQIFQGLVIRIDRKNSHTHRITVRRISSGVGVEKSFLLHSPLVLKVEVTKRSKVRRNYLSYMRQLTGKASRLSSVGFDSQSVNKIDEVEAKPDAQPPADDATADTPEEPEKTEAKDTKPAKEPVEAEAKPDAELPDSEAPSVDK